VWITGASSGIGEALALGFAGRGAKLILSARSTEKLEALAQKCKATGNANTDATVLTLDVTEEASLGAKAKTAWMTYGQVDLLINNAGISQRSSCLNTSMQTYRTLFDVDVFGQIALSKAVLPLMIEQGFGHIAVTASVAGKLGAPFRTGYCAAKHAVMGFFDALRTEVAHKNIEVTTITPGYIRTNISQNALTGDGKQYGKVDTNIRAGISAEECAEVIIRKMEKGVPEIPVGKGMEMVALKMKRWLPQTVFKMANKMYLKAAKENDFQ
jgi:short-subunit dehydrogenase